MATVSAARGILTAIAGGNGASFNTDLFQLDSPLLKPALLAIDSTAGTTITASIQGSIDGVNFFQAPYATAAAPQTPSVATFAITTTTITPLHLLEFAWLFLRVAFTANTGMTINSVKLLY